MSSKISVVIIVLLAAAAILASTLQAATAQQPQPQPQTAQGLPIVIVPAIIGNILAVVSFLIGTSSFILGLRIQSAARTTTTGSTSSSSATLPSSVMHKYFELLILALVIPSIGINAYGILLVGSHLYLPDAPYLSLLFALFIPAGAILFLVKKLHNAYKTNISSG
jgi:hypothetical protein